MKENLLRMTFVLVFFPFVLKAYSVENYDNDFDSDGTYYAYDYVWQGNNNDFNDHGTAYAYYYQTYKTYNNNGKTYLSVIASADSKDGSYLIYLPSSTKVMGIRHEGGRVYVDKQEYLEAIEKESAVCQEEQKYSSVPLSPIGSRDYLPYRQTDEGELILYDFNMQPGDKYLSVEGHDDISVASVKTITTSDGVKRRLLLLSNGYKLLEGVGCLNSPGMFFYYLNPSEAVTRYYSGCTLTRCYSFGKLNSNIYQQSDEATNIDYAASLSTNSIIQYHDLQGRRLTAEPRKGVYIRDGRKVLIK